MLWVIGMTAVVLGSERTNVERPAWIAVGAVLLIPGIYIAPANMAIRNLVLIAAAIDATVAMARLLREPAAQPVPTETKPTAVAQAGPTSRA